MADYVAAVRPQADAWAAVRPPATDADPALDSQTRAELVSAAADRAQELGLDTGARLITGRDWHGPRDWVDLLLAPSSWAGRSFLCTTGRIWSAVACRSAPPWSGSWIGDRRRSSSTHRRSQTASAKIISEFGSWMLGRDNPPVGLGAA
mgnify:CR=1 FL=1